MINRVVFSIRLHKNDEITHSDAEGSGRRGFTVSLVRKIRRYIWHVIPLLNSELHNSALKTQRLTTYFVRLAVIHGNGNAYKMQTRIKLMTSIRQLIPPSYIDKIHNACMSEPKFHFQTKNMTTYISSWLTLSNFHNINGTINAEKCSSLTTFIFHEPLHMI